MVTLYGDMISGNCYKVAWLLTALDQPFQFEYVNILEGKARTPDFLAMNPNGKIPLVSTDEGYLSESNAIIHYFAERANRYLPQDSFTKAKVLQWQFFEQYSHEPVIAVARFIQKFQGAPEHRLAELEGLQKQAGRVLAVMEHQLQSQAYFAGAEFSLADMSLYAYTHVADEGGISVADYPAIQGWLQRIQQRPDYVPMADLAAKYQ